MTKLFIIPDAHAHPEYDNDRFSALGELILKEARSANGDMHLVCLGDFADMPSLSSYDKGTKGFEGRRYDKDVVSSLDAQKKLFAAVHDYNWRRRNSSKRQLHFDTTMLVGNHEHRINRAVNAQPELDGKLGLHDLQFEDEWDRVVPFTEIEDIQGFAMSHHLPSGVAGRPVGGENAAGRLLTVGKVSCVVGHAHTIDAAWRVNYTGKKMMSIVAGCFVHADFSESWCANTRHLWWEGVHIIDNAADGFGDVRQISADTIMKGKF